MDKKKIASWREFNTLVLEFTTILDTAADLDQYTYYDLVEHLEQFFLESWT